MNDNETSLIFFSSLLAKHSQLPPPCDLRHTPHATSLKTIIVGLLLELLIFMEDSTSISFADGVSMNVDGVCYPLSAIISLF